MPRPINQGELGRAEGIACYNPLLSANRPLLIHSSLNTDLGPSAPLEAQVAPAHLLD